ncbi:sensor histidine kinase [Cognatiluteimonas profundi]|uniref:sensor histidine kinase n=1 Tax=Cognatiluteimonas profundi TaxID=2594501 RepID=UPI00131A7DD1|nr:sensor histidine kinase [Lysobacter profundi]
MFARLNHSRLLRYAGLFTWAVIGMPLLLLSLMPSEGALAEDGAVTAHIDWQAWLAYAAFGISYGWLTRGLGTRRVRAFDYVLLMVLTGSAIAISYFSASGLGSILLMVAACVLPWLLALPVGVAWLVLSEFLVVPVYMRWLDMSWLEALMQSLLYAGFSGFVFVTSLVARQQAQAREEQRQLNAELRATRALLAESARINERTRISRELHDLLGHHLTALSLNLEVAGHLIDGKAQEHVNQAHTLAKLLLSDVREAVSHLRDADAIDMAATLLPLADHVAGLDIKMEMPQPFRLDDPERAHVLLRCTQEIITNAVRHAQARTLWLHYRQDGRMVRVHAHDDGRGADVASVGNGLRGMRERLAAYGGRVDIQAAPGRGFSLDIQLPLDDGVAVGDSQAQPAPDPAMAGLATGTQV